MMNHRRPNGSLTISDMADGDGDDDDDSSETALFNRDRQLFLSSSPPVIMFGQFLTRLDMPPNYSFPAVPSSNQNDPSSSSSTGLGEFFPEEILLQILCRLPAKRVCRFRSVCRRWKALTSTPYFVELHLKHSCASNLTEILIEKQGYNFSRELYSFEAWKKGFRGARSPIAKFIGGCLSRESDYNAEAPSNKSTRVFMSFSALGFVVLRDEKTRLVPPSSSCCVILNPLTREKVKLIVANEDAGLGGQVYGLFFHPILKQICVLWGQLARLGSATLEFKLLNLAPSKSKSKSKSNSSESLPESSCWRNIIPRLHRHHPRCHSRGVIPPIILGDVLYWMVGNEWYGADVPSCEEAILAFDIKKEKFELLPHPDPGCPDDNDDEASQDSHGARRNHKWMQLLETNNGLLTLCEFSTSEKLITIWVRHSSPNGGIWMRSHMVENYPFSSSLGPDCFSQAIGMVDEELLLVHRLGVGLYVLNLKLGTVQLFETKDGNQPNLFFHAFLCAHSPSLVSMTNKKPAEIVVEVPPSIRRLKYREDIIY